MTNSRDVATFFGKRHADILRAVDDLECSADLTQRNFASCAAPHPVIRGREVRSVNMTKDGFVFLVMGFTGSKAAAFKEAGLRPPFSRDTVRPPAAVLPSSATDLPSGPSRPS